MKKFIRLIIKIPTTPFVVFFFCFGIAMMNVFLFFQWVYEADEFNTNVTKSCIKDFTGELKKWFTTI